jgi:hypothetical protein
MKQTSTLTQQLTAEQEAAAHRPVFVVTFDHPHYGQGVQAVCPSHSDAQAAIRAAIRADHSDPEDYQLTDSLPEGLVAPGGQSAGPVWVYADDRRGVYYSIPQTAVR